MPASAFELLGRAVPLPCLGRLSVWRLPVRPSACAGCQQTILAALICPKGFMNCQEKPEVKTRSGTVTLSRHNKF